MMGSMSAGWPNKWTGMMPTVRGVMRAAICAGSMVPVSGSVSQKTTLPPACVMVSVVEIHEWAGASTSSPGCTPSAFIAM
jgi:hypothetical protein